MHGASWAASGCIGLSYLQQAPLSILPMRNSLPVWLAWHLALRFPEQHWCACIWRTLHWKCNDDAMMYLRLAGHIPPLKGLMYIVAQLSGACFGILLVVRSNLMHAALVQSAGASSV